MTLRVLLLSALSMVFGSAVTIVLTKPPVVIVMLLKLGALIR